MRPLDSGAPLRHAALFGGRGEVLVWDLLKGKQAAPFSAVLACELEAGGSVGPHRQQRDPEIILCIAGLGIARVDGVEHRLEPGDVVHLPFGETLALENRSASEPLSYLIIKAQR